MIRRGLHVAAARVEPLFPGLAEAVAEGRLDQAAGGDQHKGPVPQRSAVLLQQVQADPGGGGLGGRRGFEELAGLSAHPQIKVIPGHLPNELFHG